MARQAALDVLLVNPGSRTQIYQALGGTLSAIEPPSGAGSSPRSCVVVG